MNLHWETCHKIWMYEDLHSLGNRILLRGIADGLRALGKDVCLCPVMPRDPNIAQTIRQSLMEYTPDVLFLLNHPAAHLYEQIGLERNDCPSIVWLFDDPALMSEQPFKENEIVLACDPSFIPGAKQRYATAVHFVPAAAPDQPMPDFEERYHHPIAYAGSISIDRSFRQQLSQPLAQQLQRMIKRKVEHPRESFQSIFETLQINKALTPDIPNVRSIQIQLNPRLLYFLYREANMQYRVMYAKALAAVGLHLYGNASWKPLMQKSLPSERFHTPIDPIAEFPKLARSATININIPNMQGFMAPAPREFQIPFCGGFLLSARYQSIPDDWSEFDPQKRFHLDEFPWPPSAESPGQLAALAEEFLHNEKDRNEWTEQASNAIAEHHTMPKRLEQIADILRG